MTLTLRSPAFPPDSPIPETYTCKGADRSPPLAWHAIPGGTQSLALIVDDPVLARAELVGTYERAAVEARGWIAER